MLCRADLLVAAVPRKQDGLGPLIALHCVVRRPLRDAAARPGSRGPVRRTASSQTAALSTSDSVGVSPLYQRGSVPRSRMVGAPAKRVADFPLVGRHSTLSACGVSEVRQTLQTVMLGAVARGTDAVRRQLLALRCEARIACTSDSGTSSGTGSSAHAFASSTVFSYVLR
jgi:hypothetical protein